MTIIIPQDISRCAFYTIPIFFLTYFVYRSLEYEYAEILLLLVFTSFVHWNKVLKISYIKILDMITSIMTLGLLTLYSSNRFNYHSYIIWQITAQFMIISFLINEYLFYYQVLKECPKHNAICCKKFHYFTLLWTSPNTYERKCAYYRSVYTHILILHIVPGTISIYCALHSHYNPVEIIN